MDLTATRAGFSNFGADIPSDHRVLWVEFVLKDVFGSLDKIYKRFTLLKTSDPQDVKNTHIAQKGIEATEMPEKYEGITCYSKRQFYTSPRTRI